MSTYFTKYRYANENAPFQVYLKSYTKEDVVVNAKFLLHHNDTRGVQVWETNDEGIDTLFCDIIYPYGNVVHNFTVNSLFPPVPKEPPVPFTGKPTLEI